MYIELVGIFFKTIHEFRLQGDMQRRGKGGKPMVCGDYVVCAPHLLSRMKTNSGGRIDVCFGLSVECPAIHWNPLEARLLVLVLRSYSSNEGQTP